MLFSRFLTALSTIRAIVRCHIPGTHLSPGVSVLTSSRMEDVPYSSIRFPVVRENDPDVCIQVAADMLLPVEKFLIRQPLSRCWLLAHKRRLSDGRNDCFVSMPWKVLTGWPPFRFESEGELLYYMKFYELSFKEFELMQMHSMTRPSWL